MGFAQEFLMATFLYVVFKFCDASFCVDFIGPTFTDQTLVVTDYNGRLYCKIIKTTKTGETVDCANNATATLENETYLSMRVPEGPNVTFLLEFGRDHESGKSLSSYSKVCPTSDIPTSVISTTSPTTGHLNRNRLFICYPVSVIVVAVSALIYGKYKCCIRTQKEKTVPMLETNGNALMDKKTIELEEAMCDPSRQSTSPLINDQYSRRSHFVPLLNTPTPTCLVSA